MNEIDDRTSQDASADIGVNPGARLAEARERLKLSAADVARQLKLSVAQVEALESGQFDRLPGVVFVRGFIRNYARLVKLDPDELLEAGAGSLPQQIARPEAPPSQNIPFPSSRPRRWRRYIWVAAVLVAALAFYEFFVSSEETVVTTHPIEVTPAPLTVTIPKEEKKRPEPVAALPKPETASPAPMAAPPKPMTVSPAPMAAPSNAEKVVTAEKTPAPSQASTQPARAAEKQSATERAEVAPAPDDPVKPPPAAAVAPAPQPESASVQPGPAERQVTLVFEDESWVEIRDRYGKVLLYQLNPPGAREAVNGLPPLSFVIGNPQSVRLTYDDRPVDLEPYSRTGVARMTLE